MLGLALLFVTLDNCCTVRGKLDSQLGGQTVRFLLDYWHFQQRYLTTVVGNTKNPHYKEVAADITNSIMARTAQNGTPALYRECDEQEKRLRAVYDKWEKKGGVWSALSPAAHTAQLNHVRAGCLDRQKGLEHLPNDSSRIESMHSQLNNLQRAVAGGLVIMLALCFDFFQRRNLRIDIKNGLSPFGLATQSCHHLSLVDAALEREQLAFGTSPARFPKVASSEEFGLVKSGLETSYVLFHCVCKIPLLTLLHFRVKPEEEIELEVPKERPVPGWEHFLRLDELGVDTERAAELTAIPLYVTLPLCIFTSTLMCFLVLSLLALRSFLDLCLMQHSHHRPSGCVPTRCMRFLLFCLSLFHSDYFYSPTTSFNPISSALVRTPSQLSASADTAFSRRNVPSASVALLASTGAPQYSATTAQTSSSRMAFAEWKIFTDLLLEKRIDEPFTPNWNIVASEFNTRLHQLHPTLRWHDRRDKCEYRLYERTARGLKDKSLDYFGTRKERFEQTELEDRMLVEGGPRPAFRSLSLLLSSDF